MKKYKVWVSAHIEKTATECYAVKADNEEDALALAEEKMREDLEYADFNVKPFESVVAGGWCEK